MGIAALKIGTLHKGHNFPTNGIYDDLFTEDDYDMNMDTNNADTRENTTKTENDLLIYVIITTTNHMNLWWLKSSENYQCCLEYVCVTTDTILRHIKAVFLLFDTNKKSLKFVQKTL